MIVRKNIYFSLNFKIFINFICCYVRRTRVSGFSEDELEVEVKESILRVKGSVQEKQNDSAFLHRGISGKDFERTFTLNADIIVVGAELVNGLLVIELEHVIPEEKKPRRIDIGGSKTLPNKKKKFLAE